MSFLIRDKDMIASKAHLRKHPRTQRSRNPSLLPTRCHTLCSPKRHTFLLKDRPLRNSQLSADRKGPGSPLLSTPEILPSGLALRWRFLAAQHQKEIVQRSIRIALMRAPALQCPFHRSSKVELEQLSDTGVAARCCCSMKVAQSCSLLSLFIHCCCITCMVACTCGMTASMISGAQSKEILICFFHNTACPQDRIQVVHSTMFFGLMM